MDKTFYTIRTMAVKLGVSEKTIYRMLNDNRLPFAVKIGGQWRFRADAIDGWLLARTGSQTGNRRADRTISVHDALQQGAVFYRIHGRNRDECIDELLSALPHSSTIDCQAVKLSIFTRESLVSSSLQGIAYMGVSSEHPVFFEKTMVLLAHLEADMDFKSLDGVKTFAVFLVLPANTAEQAIIEAKLHRLSMEPKFREMIAGNLMRKDLLHAIRHLEQEIFPEKKGSRETVDARHDRSSS